MPTIMNVSNNFNSLYKSLFLNQSLNLNAVLSRNVQFSCLVTGRKKIETLWPNEPKKWPGGKDFYGFTYYPRYPDQVEPSWERTPLFMVQRRKPVTGQPFWLKRIMRDLRIEQKVPDMAILINDETMNAKLWKIKHLITITPITFPDGIPEEKDLDSCRIYPNGELRFRSVLKTDPVRMKATEVFQQSLDRLDKETIQKYTRKVWDDGFVPYKDF